MFGQLGKRAGQCAVGAVAAADVAYLSGAMFTGGVTDPRDAADLIAFDRMVVADAPEWAAFFIGAITNHMLVHVAPADEITAEKAEWLAAQLAPKGHGENHPAESPRALPLLLRLMEGAQMVAQELPAFALRQILAGVITGEGPVSGGHSHFSRAVDAHEVALLRRVLGAGGGGQGRPVSRAEAELLFDIHVACAGSVNDPGFDPLFVRAVQQHVRAASGLNAGSRSSLFAPILDAGNGAHLALDRLAMAGYQPDLTSLVEATPLSAKTARWLAVQLHRSGDSAAGRALSRLLAENGGADTASLRALIDHAA